jgi:SAM-dependent methyltransferase
LATFGLSSLNRKVRGKVRWLYLTHPKKVQCNVCGWSGRHFNSDGWHPFTICWKCGSSVRHRLLIESFNRIEGLTYRDIIDGKRILHFAPESQLIGLLKPRAGSYRTTDFCRDDLDLKLDLTNMPSIPDVSVDVLIAADVLEHVPDHMQGMREIFRVLSSGGWAILTVPQPDSLAKTWGDPTITDPAERERVFGQDDHLRLFGEDMVELLESVGFHVRVIDASSFPAEVVKQNVLVPPVLSERPLATNHRRVFFARKP